jgi:hypothetical protein
LNQQTVDPGIKANAWTQWLIVRAGTILLWLSATLWGTAFLLAAVWWFFRLWGKFQPFTLPQLLAWFGSLEPGSRVAIGGWFLTMMGFMIAFWTASFTWRKHKELELRIEAAKAAHASFQAAFIKLKLINQYLRALVDIGVSARKHPDDGQMIQQLRQLNDYASTFIELRRDLDTAVVDTSSVIACYIPIFQNVFTVADKINTARDALATITEELWKFEPPKADPNALEFVQIFTLQYDPVTTLHLASEGAKALRYASTYSGFARGRLFGSVVRANGWALTWTTPKKLYSVLGDVNQRRS